MKVERPRLLDLFCGAGGAAMGYYRAGFEVVGVDIVPQPRYPFPFVQMDALEYAREHYQDFDVIHASPPCQAYSHSRHLRSRSAKKITPKLIADVRANLWAWRKPFVIENVEGARADMANPAMACGIAFGLETRRHRLFESNVCLLLPPCSCYVRRREVKYPSTPRLNGTRLLSRFVNLHASGTSAELASVAMGIDWIPSKGFRPTQGLREAIPPAYTEFIGRQLLQVVQRQ